MNTDTAIAIPAKITGAVNPPLKKAELIKALAIRKQAQLQKERNETTAMFTKETTAIREEIRRIAEAFDTSDLKLIISDPYVGADHETGKKYVTGPEARIVFDVELPASLKKRIIENDERKHTLRCTELPSLSEIERQLRNELSGQASNRVNAILEDEVACKAIDTLLAKIDRKAECKGLVKNAVNV